MPPQFLIDAQGRPLNSHTNRIAERGSYQNSDFALPPTLTFTGMIGGANHTLWLDRFDEAMRSSRDDAKVMENDCFLMGLMQERKLAVASLPWHIEVPNPKDPVQLEVQTGLQDRVATMPRFRMFLMSILEAIWFGRYGEQVKWTWEPSGGRRFLHLAKWTPINGDKIGHQEDGTPFILGNAARLSERSDIETIITTRGMAVRLNRQWRDRFIIHSHELYDADFFDYERAEAIFGLGVRSRVFFLNFLKLNFLGAVTTFMERVGLGITLWYFPAGNEKARAEAQSAAEDQSDRTNILIPTYEDQKGAKSVERVEVPTTGSELLMKFSEQIDKWIERYVIGQSMSSGEDKESGLGGTGRAEFAKDTKNQIRNMDAANAEETLTGTEEAPGLISMMQKYSYPETWPSPSNPRGFRARFVFDAESSDPDKKLEAASKLFTMNIPFKMDEAREAGGFTKPDADDEVAVQQQKQPGMGGMPGAGGAPGGEPAEGSTPAGPGTAPEMATPPGAPPAQPGAPPAGGGATPSTNGTAPAPEQPGAVVGGWQLSGVGPRGGHTWRKGNRTVRSRMPPGQSRDSGRFVNTLWQMAQGNGEGVQALARVPESVPYAYDESKHPRGQPENAGEFAPKGQGGGVGRKSEGGSGEGEESFPITLWRTADDDLVVGSASFSTSKAAAKKYLDNPGFGGRNLYRAKVEINRDELLDLYDEDHEEAVRKITDLIGGDDPGAIGIDEWVPRVADKLQDAGIEWVRVRESYPSDSETYIFVGSNDPEMDEMSS